MSDLTPPVTWLLPVKNGLPFLPETLASIEAQTYHHWQVLAWDNGSTDGTVDVLRQWIPERIPGRVITGKPLGLADSLREMVSLAETGLCARIDADDVNMPDRLEKQVEYLARHPDTALVGTQMRRSDIQGQTHEIMGPEPTDYEDILATMLLRNPISHPTVLFRRQAVLEVGNYRNIGPINVEDYDLWLRLGARHRLHNLDDVLLHYRVHPKSTTQIAIGENKLQKALDERFCEHGPALFGITPNEAKLLCERKVYFGIVLAWEIAGKLASVTKSTRIGFLRRQQFVATLRSMTRRQDIFSRMLLAFARLDGKLLLHDCAEFIRMVCFKLAYVGGFTARKPSQSR